MPKKYTIKTEEKKKIPTKELVKRLNLTIKGIICALIVAFACTAAALVLSIVALATHDSPTVSSSLESPLKSQYKHNDAIWMPKVARKINDDTYHLGRRFHNGITVEGYAHLHRQRNRTTNRVSNLCYGFNAPGARWKITEPYGISTTNGQGISPTLILHAVQAAINSWNSILSQFTIFGNYDSTIVVDGADFDSPDGKNEWQFGNIQDPGVIAVTITWGVFDGPIDQRQIVEWDQVFDIVDYSWGDASITLGKMDIQNIGTHESGHAAGLTDQYSTDCSFATMYGYASVGQISKRILSSADKTGICVLYGECVAEQGDSSDTWFVAIGLFHWLLILGIGYFVQYQS